MLIFLLDLFSFSQYQADQLKTGSMFSNATSIQDQYIHFILLVFILKETHLIENMCFHC